MVRIIFTRKLSSSLSTYSANEQSKKSIVRMLVSGLKDCFKMNTRNGAAVAEVSRLLKIVGNSGFYED